MVVNLIIMKPKLKSTKSERFSDVDKTKNSGICRQYS